jgi:HEAT repeat protein
LDKLKAQAVQTLRHQLTSSSELERADAAIALGRIGDQASAKDLKAMASGDRSANVRARASLAMWTMWP